MEEDEPLRVAAHKGHAEIVRELLKAGANVHCKEEYPIREAILGKHYDVAEILLDYGAIVDFECGGTLFLAQMIEFGNYEAVEFLLRNGADVDINSGMPLWEAVYGRSPDLVKLLIDYGADLYKGLALKEACLYGYTEIVKIFLDYGADKDRLLPAALPEMREYVPVNLRRVSVVGN